jgi:hypothetical protein
VVSGPDRFRDHGFVGAGAGTFRIARLLLSYRALGNSSAFDVLMIIKIGESCGDGKAHRIFLPAREIEETNNVSGIPRKRPLDWHLVERTDSAGRLLEIWPHTVDKGLSFETPESGLQILFLNFHRGFSKLRFEASRIVAVGRRLAIDLANKHRPNYASEIGAPINKWMNHREIIWSSVYHRQLAEP